MKFTRIFIVMAVIFVSAPSVEAELIDCHNCEDCSSENLLCIGGTENCPFDYDGAQGYCSSGNGNCRLIFDICSCEKACDVVVGDSFGIQMTILTPGIFWADPAMNTVNFDMFPSVAEACAASAVTKNFGQISYYRDEACILAGTPAGGCVSGNLPVSNQVIALQSSVNTDYVMSGEDSGKCKLWIDIPPMRADTWVVPGDSVNIRTAFLVNGKPLCECIRQVGTVGYVQDSAYELALTDNITLNSSSIQQNQSFDVLVNFANTGTGSFTGKYCAAYFDSDGEFVDYVEIMENMSMPGGYGYYSDPLTFSSAPVASEAGTYSVYIYYEPDDGSEWIMMPSGDYSNHATLIIDTSSPYELALTDDITLSPSSIQQNQSFDVLVNFANSGTGSFTGKYCAAYFDSDGKFVDYVEIMENMSMAGGYGYYSDPLKFSSAPVDSEPGTYSVYIYYKPDDFYDWIDMPSGSYSNYASLTIESSSLHDLSLYSNITVSPNPIRENQAIDVTVDIGNNGTGLFNGTYCVALFDQSKEFVDYIEIREDMSLEAGYHYVNGLTFYSAGIITDPGEYYIYVFHKPDNGDWIRTASGDYENPIPVWIESPVTTYTISGYVKDSDGNGLHGATVTFSDGGGSAVTDSAGYYAKTVSSDWNGTVVPVMNGYTFNPTSRSYSYMGSDRSGQNYAGTAKTYSVSGYIKDSGGNGLEGVRINFSNAAGSATTDYSGYYIQTVSHGWSGTVIPGKSNYFFAPPSRSYNQVISNHSEQNYSGALDSSVLPDINVTPASLSFSRPRTRSVRIFAKPENHGRSRDAHADDLFTEISEENFQLSERQDALWNHLESLETTSESKIVQVNSGLLRTSEAVNLNLFEGENYSAFRTRIEERGDEDFSWYGSIGEEGMDNALCVVRMNNLTGIIRTDGELYSIRPLGQGFHAIIRQDPSFFPPDLPSPKVTLPSAERRKTARSGDDGSVQHILVAYTEASLREAGDIDSVIQLAIDETNQSYRNSDISFQVELAYSYQTDYRETGDMLLDLERLTQTDDNYMDEVHELRNLHTADMVMLLVTVGRPSGIAWAPPSPNSDYAFCVVKQKAATGHYTFAHELGHIQGANHNPEESRSEIPYGHGYTDAQSCFRTIMSYPKHEDYCPNCKDCSRCDYGSCRRIPYWSNPNARYLGEPTGTASTHDNARVLNESALSVANFRVSETGKTFTIQNLGSSPLRITSVTTDQDWLRISGYPSTPFNIAEGMSQTVEVDVNWGAVGTSTQGKITIQSDDPDEPSAMVTVSLMLISGDVAPAEPMLSVMPTFQNLSAAGGTARFIVDNTGSGTMHWTAKSDESWLSIIDGNSGTNHSQITVTYNMNTGDERTGTITVSAPGVSASEQTLRIRQSEVNNMGDVDGNGVIDLRDVVLALQVVSGMNPGGIALDDEMDINHDGKIGLEEPVYLLREIAEMEDGYGIID